MTGWSWPLRVIAPLVVGFVLLVDFVSLSPAVEADQAFGGGNGTTEQVVPGAGALTSTWFCPVVHMNARGVNPTGGELGGLTTELVLDNITDDVIRASVALAVSNRATQEIAAVVLPHQREVLPLEGVALDLDEVISATVEASSGGLVVSRRFTSNVGSDASACSTLVTDRWYAPLGDTQSDATNLLMVFNPLPRDAVVDVTVATELEDGPFDAPGLRGLVVPAGAATIVDVGQHARRRDLAAAFVTALSGRVVVDHVVAYDGTAGRRGLSAELAGVTAATDWLVAVPGVGVDRSQWVSVQNPTDEVAEVRLQLVVDRGAALAGAVTSGQLLGAGVADTVSVVVSPGEAVQYAIRPDSDLLIEIADDETAGDDATEDETAQAGEPQESSPDAQPLVREAAPFTLYAPTGSAATLHVSSRNGVDVAVATEVIYGSTVSPTGTATSTSAAAVVGAAGTTNANSTSAASGVSIAPAKAAPGRTGWVVMLPPHAGGDAPSAAYVTIHLAPVSVLTGGTDSSTAARVFLRRTDGTVHRSFVVAPDAPVTVALPAGAVRLIEADHPVVATATVRDGSPSAALVMPVGT